VFQFQEQWLGQDPPKRFNQAVDKPIDRYNKDGNSDLLLVSSDSMFFEVHTVILSDMSEPSQSTDIIGPVVLANPTMDHRVLIAALFRSSIAIKYHLFHKEP